MCLQTSIFFDVSCLFLYILRPPRTRVDTQLSLTPFTLMTIMPSQNVSHQYVSHCLSHKTPRILNSPSLLGICVIDTFHSRFLRNEKTKNIILYSQWDILPSICLFALRLTFTHTTWHSSHSSHLELSCPVCPFPSRRTEFVQRDTFTTNKQQQEFSWILGFLDSRRFLERWEKKFDGHPSNWQSYMIECPPTHNMMS